MADNSRHRYNAPWGWRLLHLAAAVDWGAHVAHNFPGRGTNVPTSPARSETAVPAGQWSHIAFTYDGSLATFWRGGRSVFAQDLSASAVCGPPRRGEWVAPCRTEMDPPPLRGLCLNLSRAEMDPCEERGRVPPLACLLLRRLALWPPDLLAP